MNGTIIVVTTNSVKNFLTTIILSGQDALFQAQRMVMQAVYRPLQDQITKHQEYQEAQLLSHLISAGKQKLQLKVHQLAVRLSSR